jgi:hypothetical protein
MTSASVHPTPEVTVVTGPEAAGAWSGEAPRPGARLSGRVVAACLVAVVVAGTGAVLVPRILQEAPPATTTTFDGTTPGTDAVESAHVTRGALP